jgi:hypothetical protein
LTPPFFLAIIGEGTNIKMSIKLILLKSGEKLISDAKELVSDTETDNKKVYAYFLCNPQVVTTRSKVLLTEEKLDSDVNNFEIDVVLSPWMILSQDKDFVIPTDWVVTISEPLASVRQMYVDKTSSSLNIEEKEKENE